MQSSFFSLTKTMINQMTFVVHNILFVARVTSLAPEWSEGANDAMTDTNKLYAQQKSCGYHYYQYSCKAKYYKFI